MNIALLEMIREAGGEFVPFELLGPDLFGVFTDLDELEAFGFGLERHPYHGVAFRAPSPRLCPDQIEWKLGTRTIGRRVAVWNRVGSTNDLAARASSSLANEGLAILAEERGDPSTAARLWDEILAERPDDPEASQARGRPL